MKKITMICDLCGISIETPEEEFDSSEEMSCFNIYTQKTTYHPVLIGLSRTHLCSSCLTDAEIELREFLKGSVNFKEVDHFERNN